MWMTPSTFERIEMGISTLAFQYVSSWQIKLHCIEELSIATVTLNVSMVTSSTKEIAIGITILVSYTYINEQWMATLGMGFTTHVEEMWMATFTFKDIGMVASTYQKIGMCTTTLAPFYMCTYQTIYK